MKYLIYFFMFNIFVFSSNAEDYWEKTSGPEGATIYSIVAGDNGILYAGAYNRIYKSTNNGEEWAEVFYDYLTNNFTSLMISSDGNVHAGCRGFIYKSTDNGNEWKMTTRNLDHFEATAMAEGRDGVLYTGTNGYGVFRSTDSGNKWEKYNTGLDSAMKVSGIAIDNDNRIFISTNDGIYYSDNDGEKWAKDLSVIGSDEHYIDIKITSTGSLVAITKERVLHMPPDHPWIDISSAFDSTLSFTTIAVGDMGIFYLGTEKTSIFKYFSGVTGWLPIDDAANQEILCIALDSENNIYSSVIRAGLYLMKSNETTFSGIGNGFSPFSVNSVAIDNNNYIYAATLSGGLFKSEDDGLTWNVLPDLPMIDIKRIVCSEYNNYLYAGSVSGLYISTDSGDSWTKKSDTSIACILPTGENELLIGTAAKGVFKTDGLADNWTQINSGIDISAIGSVETIIKTTDGSLFMGMKGYLGGVYRSDDNGETWLKKDLGLGSLSASKLLEVSENLILIATMDGQVLRTTDKGEMWEWYSQDMLATLVHDLIKTSQGRVYAATYGHGVYELNIGNRKWINYTDGMDVPTATSLAENSDGYIFAGTVIGGVYKSILPGVGVDEKGNEKGLVYPNPVEDFLYIDSDYYSSLTIADYSGRTIGVYNYRKRIDFSQFPSGLYFIRVEIDGRTKDYKVVKM